MYHTTKSGQIQASAKIPHQTPIPSQVFAQPVPSENDQPTIRDLAAHVAHLLGVETFPLVGKEPVRGHKWGTDRKRGSPGVQSATAQAWARATGYAIMPIVGSNLYILDCDSLEFLRQLFSTFPSLVSTPTTYSGDQVRAVEGHCHFFIRLTLAAPITGTRASRGPGGTELASLRGPGAYVVGPGSGYPGSDQRYTGNSIAEPVRFNAQDTARLLSLFDPPHAQSRVGNPNPNAPHAIRRHPSSCASDVDLIAAVLRNRGYRANGAWLNGPCLHPENHRNADAHPSFGVNTVSGVGHCFVPGCGDHSPVDVCAFLGLNTPFSVFAGGGPAIASSPHNDAESAMATAATVMPGGSPVIAPLPHSGAESTVAYGGRPYAPASDYGDRPYIFVGEMRNGLPDLPNGGREPGAHLCVELNLAAALFRRGCYQSARFYDILWANARAHGGQVIYQTAELVALGTSYGLSRDQVNKALRQMCQLGLLEKAGHGLYRRVGLSHIRERFGLGEEFAPVYLPRSAYTGAPADYFQVVLLAIEHYLPKGLASATIGNAAGVSRGAVYDHERRLGVLRETVTKRVGMASASDPSFIKVYDAQGQYVTVLDGKDTYGACEIAMRSGGEPWGWRQMPSCRLLPDLPVCRSAAASS